MKRTFRLVLGRKPKGHILMETWNKRIFLRGLSFLLNIDKKAETTLIITNKKKGKRRVLKSTLEHVPDYVEQCPHFQ